MSFDKEFPNRLIQNFTDFDIKAQFHKYDQVLLDIGHNQVRTAKEIAKIKNVVAAMAKELEKLKKEVDGVYSYYGCK